MNYTIQNVEMPDRELIEKYNVSGPRYTSYPTALHFEAIEQQEWIDQFDRIDHDRPLSLYVHLPFCPSLCLYCGCNVQITNRRERIAEYLRYVVREMELFQSLIGTDRSVEQIHWGGGSPSYLTPEEIERLGKEIKERFNVADDAEISVEIDPRGLTRRHVEAFHQAGFNRASIGVQDIDPEVQEAIGRLQTFEETQRAVEWLREVDIESINIDLIYGLPHQTTERFRKTLEQVVTLHPDRLAVFNFAYVPTVKRHQQAIDTSTLPSGMEKIDLLFSMVSFLTDVGYQFIGFDHFAKPKDELAIAKREGKLHRNFQGYTTRGDCDLIGFGATSISMLDRCYAQNYKGLPDYYQALQQDELPVERGVKLSRDDMVRRSVIRELMCNLAVKKEQVEKIFNLNFDEYFAEGIEKLNPLIEDGLVSLDADLLQVSPKGQFFLRNIALCFDGRYGAEKARYSRTV